MSGALFAELRGRHAPLAGAGTTAGARATTATATRGPSGRGGACMQACMQRARAAALDLGGDELAQIVRQLIRRQVPAVVRGGGVRVGVRGRGAARGAASGRARGGARHTVGPVAATLPRPIAWRVRGRAALSAARPLAASPLAARRPKFSGRQCWHCRHCRHPRRAANADGSETRRDARYGRYGRGCAIAASAAAAAASAAASAAPRAALCGEPLAVMMDGEADAEGLEGGERPSEFEHLHARGGAPW